MYHYLIKLTKTPDNKIVLIALEQSFNPTFYYLLISKRREGDMMIIDVELKKIPVKRIDISDGIIKINNECMLTKDEVEDVIAENTEELITKLTSKPVLKTLSYNEIRDVISIFTKLKYM